MSDPILTTNLSLPAFKNPTLLKLALTHKSFGNEFTPHAALAERNNERLELLGDAILDFIVTVILLEQFKTSTEGEISKFRARLVNEKTLAIIAKDLNLGNLVFLGKGEEQTGGRLKESILASCLEALIAAYYLDQGFEQAKNWVSGLFEKRIDSTLANESTLDYKTKLQELVQAKFKTAPRYEVVQSTGPEHDKTFFIRVLINQDTIAEASGKSKKDAEQTSAKLALEKLTTPNS